MDNSLQADWSSVFCNVHLQPECLRRSAISCGIVASTGIRFIAFSCGLHTIPRRQSSNTGASKQAMTKFNQVCLVRCPPIHEQRACGTVRNQQTACPSSAAQRVPSACFCLSAGVSCGPHPIWSPEQLASAPIKVEHGTHGDQTVRGLALLSQQQ